MILHNKTKGIIYIILAALGFSLMAAFAKLAGDIPFTQKMFFRNIIPFVFTGIILFKNKRFTLRKENVSLFFARSIYGTLGMFCTFYAIDRMLLADATILFKLSPFFAVLMSIFILKERIGFTRILIILGAFIGSIFIINPSFESFSINVPFFAAFIAAFFAGTAYTFVRKLGQKGEDGTIIVFFFSAFSTIAILPFFIFSFEPMSTAQISHLCLAGVSATFGQFAVTRAYMYAPAREISVFDYSQVVFAAILGFFLYNEIPTAYSFIGYIIITSMGILSFLYKTDSK